MSMSVSTDQCTVSSLIRRKKNQRDYTFFKKYRIYSFDEGPNVRLTTFETSLTLITVNKVNCYNSI